MTADSAGATAPAEESRPGREQTTLRPPPPQGDATQGAGQASVSAWGTLAGRFRWVGALKRLPWVARLYLAVAAGFTGLSVLLLWPITGGDYPPGVDTPTFLHLSWVAKLAVSGQLPNLLQDPYWYGGFFYLMYSPLGYGLVGATSALTSINLVTVYNSLLMLSYGALGFSTWFLAREFGLRWWAAVVAGLFATIAYPAINAVFLWGWFTSVMALPFALVSIACLERSLRARSPKPALLAGVLLALSTLTHHMTGLAVVLGLVPWFGYHLVLAPYSRRRLVVHTLICGATTALIIAPWAIPLLREVSEVGFRREIPGNWLPQISTYRSNILNPSLVGLFIYPSYLGIVLIVLAVVGTVIALIERHRLTGMVLILWTMAWFSMGARANPLINHYPFSSLDVGRFQLYMAPFLALLAALALDRFFQLAADSGARRFPPLVWRSLVVLALAAVLTYPAYDAWKARGLARPYIIQPAVQQALEWLAAVPPDPQGKPAAVYSVGLWNWHAFLVPYLAGHPVVDGWHDEGGANVKLIRRLRGMAWIGGQPVDPAAAHQILTTLGANYVLLHRSYWPGERTVEFWEQFERHPDLFVLRERWGPVGVFQVLSPGGWWSSIR